MNHEYDINITIFDADDHVIYPSENILTKTTFGKQFDVIDISVRKRYLFQAKLHGGQFSRLSKGEWSLGSSESSGSRGGQDKGKQKRLPFEFFDPVINIPPPHLFGKNRLTLEPSGKPPIHSNT